MLGKIESKRRSGWQRIRWLDGITDSTDISLSRFWEMVKRGKPGVLQSIGSQRVRHNWATEQQNILDCRLEDTCSDLGLESSGFAASREQLPSALISPHLSFCESKVKGLWSGGTVKRWCSSLCKQEDFSVLETSCSVCPSPPWENSSYFSKILKAFQVVYGTICLTAAVIFSLDFS